MAKKTSKQGKNANTNTETKKVEASVKASTDAFGTPKKADKPAKATQPAKDKKPAKDQPKAKASKAAPKKDGIVKKATTYVKNVRLEIKRTTWPSRQEVLRMSLIVVGALLFFGVFIFIMDWVMTHLLELYSGLVPDPSAVDPSTAPDAGTTPPASDAPSSDGTAGE
jgi:preprotein translocase subunit SecE